MKPIAIFVFAVAGVSFFYGTMADNACIFEHPTKGIINLNSVGLQNGQARFQDYGPVPLQNYLYSFNPCFSFSERTCENAAACQRSLVDGAMNTIAVQKSAKWTAKQGANPTAVLTYTHGAKSLNVTMYCMNTNTTILQVENENPTNSYSMRLWSPCACWNGCNKPHPTSTPRVPTTVTKAPSPISSACRYHDPQRGIIDLTSIGSMTGTPAFKDIKSKYSVDSFLWSYNPCYSFSEYNCRNAAACQIDSIYQTGNPIGLQEYASWSNSSVSSGRPPSIVYSPTYDQRQQHLTVQLVCDSSSFASHHLEVLGEVFAGQYVMQLTSPCACWNGCVTPPRPSANFMSPLIIGGIALAVVTILLIIMLTCLFASKPTRRFRRIVLINEKTPMLKAGVN